jgi:hypothetical protein
MAAKARTDQTIIEGFLLRARRVMAHSLLREQAALMSKLHKGEVTFAVTVNAKTGERQADRMAECRGLDSKTTRSSGRRPTASGSVNASPNPTAIFPGASRA